MELTTQQQSQAIKFHYGGDGAVRYGFVKGILQWYDKIKPKPSDEEIIQWFQQLSEHDDSVQYRIDRVYGTEEKQIRYASLEDQEDMKYWDLKNSTNTWVEHIDDVKATHEKPTG